MDDIMTDQVCTCPMSVRETGKHSIACPRYDEGVKPHHTPEQAAVILDTPQQINLYALLVTTMAAESKARGGLQLTSKMPSLKVVCKRWGIEARTWREAAKKLRDLYEAEKREQGIES